MLLVFPFSEVTYFLTQTDKGGSGRVKVLNVARLRARPHTARKAIWLNAVHRSADVLSLMIQCRTRKANLTRALRVCFLLRSWQRHWVTPTRKPCWYGTLWSCCQKGGEGINRVSTVTWLVELGGQMVFTRIFFGLLQHCSLLTNYIIFERGVFERADKLVFSIVVIVIDLHFLSHGTVS